MITKSLKILAVILNCWWILLMGGSFVWFAPKGEFLAWGIFFLSIGLPLCNLYVLFEGKVGPVRLFQGFKRMAGSILRKIFGRWPAKKLKKPGLWFFPGVVFLSVFSVVTAFGVKYVTNERLIDNSNEALEHSLEARSRGECISGEWGAYRAWGRYEPKMWQQIAMLYEIENSPLTLPGQKRTARKTEDRLVSYFRTHGMNYVSYIEDVFGEWTFREFFDEKMDEAIDESEVGDILRQMRPAADEMVAELEALFESFHGIKRRALIVYHMRLVENREADSNLKENEGEEL